MKDQKFYYENDVELNIFYEILDYANSQANFKNDFLDSIEKILNKNGKINENQFNVIRKIYEFYKFKMEKWKNGE
jgi:hypothetical protein